MIPTACGILAGGASTRMRRNKALLPFRGKPLIRHQLDLLQPLFSEVLISANNPATYAGLGIRVVPDVFAEPCSLSGIHALLEAVTAQRLFVVACDMPFLNAELIRRMRDVPGDFDVIVPETEEGFEPLHAIYARTCLPAIERSAKARRWKISDFYDGLWVDQMEIRTKEWLVEGRSPFLNANTPDQWHDTAP